MKRIWTTLALAALAATLALAVACGDDDDGGNGGNDSGTPDAEASAIAPPPTPFPTPLIEGNTIRSNGKGYSATFPPDWRPRANQIQTADASTDAFFEPTGQIANIAVTCVTDVSLPPAERVVAEQTRTSRIGLSENIRVSQRTVAGIEATVMDYTFISEQTGGAGPLDKQDILFSNDHCHWTISTVTREGERAQYEAAFNTFIDSFQLFPPTAE